MSGVRFWLAMGAVCLPGGATNPAFQPKLQETGGPKALYSIRSEQLPGLFRMGSTLAQITQVFGPPTLSGDSTSKNGQTTHWVIYTYGRSYTHVDKRFNVLAVNRFCSATLQFNGSEVLSELSLSKYQNYATGTVNREATDQEVAQYLGAPEPLDIKVPEADAAKAEAPPQVWKLGIEVSELRSEYITRTGYNGRGVYVVAVDPKGLGALAGLRPGDVITQLNGAPTPTRDDLVDRLKAIPVTTSLVLEVFTDGRLRTVTVSAAPTGEGTVSI